VRRAVFYSEKVYRGVPRSESRGTSGAAPGLASGSE